jgi:CBS domain containing-hemolysin-like protein
MVIGELAPKNFALAVPLATAKVVVPFQLAFTAVFRPVVLLLNGTANRVVRALGIEPKEELSAARSADELGYLVRHSAQAGVLERHDATLLDRSLRFAALDATDVMTPRVRMTTVPVRATAADVVAASLASGHSRLPVVDGGPDDIVGVVHVKQAWTVSPGERDRTPVTALMSPPVLVPDSTGADSLLATLRAQGLQLAVVTDEYGGTAGLVTLEDLVEEIVGSLEDEFDRAGPDLVRRGRSLVFDASLRPDELADRTGVAVPASEDWDTVAGFVLDRLGRLPELGDEVPLPAGGGLLRVERIDGRRIVRLRHVPGDVAEDRHEPAYAPAERGQEVRR